MKRILLLLISVILISCYAAAVEFDTDSEPIVIFLPYRGDDSSRPPDDSLVIQKIEEYCGVELDIHWISSANYDKEISQLARSGIYPDILFNHSLLKRFDRWNEVAGSTYIDITDYLDQFSNLSSIPTDAWDSVSCDGRIYEIPVMQYGGSRALAVRKDWLATYRDVTGAGIPRNVEDIANMLNYFSNGDPDGDGVENSVGMIVDTNLQSLPDFLAMFGGTWNYTLSKDDEVKASITTDEFLATIKYMRDLYNRGSIILGDGEGKSAGAYFISAYQVEELERVTGVEYELLGSAETGLGNYADINIADGSARYTTAIY